MKQTFEELFLTIVQDGGTVTVGDKTFNVTLAEAVTLGVKPVEGKWYRAWKNQGLNFIENNWYKNKGKSFVNKNGYMIGLSDTDALNYFDLSTPLDFDPETLVGKTLGLNPFEKFTVEKIENGNYIGVWRAGEDEFYSITYIIDCISKGIVKILDPETTLTVPENVEFYHWAGDIALRYNGLILSPYAQGNNFSLSNAQEVGDPPKSPLQLIPCKLSEVQNGEWVVHNQYIDNPIFYRLKTEKGLASFNGSDECPIMIQSKLSDSINWLKVVQG